MAPLLHLFGISMGFCFHSTLAMPLTFYGLVEGSTYEEDLSNFTSVSPSVLSSEHRPTPGSPAHVDVDFLEQLENFLVENMLLLLVVTTLIFILMLMICGAVFMSHRRKVNAYYPSSFPSKMYVDHRDKVGGAKPFHEVPEKTAPEQKHEAVNLHQQLQEDIVKASRNLRTPQRPAEDGDPGQTQEQQGPEEDKACQPSDEVSVEEEPQEPLSPRPPSLHLHSDCATLELIQGEKTAF